MERRRESILDTGRDSQRVGSVGSSLLCSCCGLSAGLAAFCTPPNGCQMSSPGVSVEPRCQDGQQRL